MCSRNTLPLSWCPSQDGSYTLLVIDPYAPHWLHYKAFLSSVYSACHHYKACSTRCLSKAKLARPNIIRLISFTLFTHLTQASE